MKNTIKSAILGHAIGDALGVPVEFSKRYQLIQNPVLDYRAFGTWNQPAGTFSDDTSMMLCTVESLCNGLSYNDIATQFSRWYQDGYWGAHHKLFDIGNTTRNAILNFNHQKINAETCGLTGVDSNGNGSLMRILPLIFFLYPEMNMERRHEIVSHVSSITHGHFIAKFSCFIFVEFGIQLLKSKELNCYDKLKVFETTKKSINDFASTIKDQSEKILLFDGILNQNLVKSPDSLSFISGSGYVLDSIKASLYCFLTTNTYSEAVLKAVNLGEDTDTTAAITGGLAGLWYGLDDIPQKWISGLARHDEIIQLAEKYAVSLNM